MGSDRKSIHCNVYNPAITTQPNERTIIQSFTPYLPEADSRLERQRAWPAGRSCKTTADPAESAEGLGGGGISQLGEGEEDIKRVRKDSPPGRRGCTGASPACAQTGEGSSFTHH